MKHWRLIFKEISLFLFQRKSVTSYGVRIYHGEKDFREAMTLWSRELARREKARTYFRELTETDRHRVQEECGGGDWVSCPSHWMQWLSILEPGSEQVTPWESHHTLRYGEGKSVMSHPKDAAPTLNPKTCPPQNGAMAQRSKVSFSLSKQQHTGENKKIVSCDSPEFNSPLSPIVLMINPQLSSRSYEALQIWPAYTSQVPSRETFPPSLA